MNLLLVVDLERRGHPTPCINNKIDHFPFRKNNEKNASAIRERVEGMTEDDLERAVCVCVCVCVRV